MLWLKDAHSAWSGKFAMPSDIAHGSYGLEVMSWMASGSFSLKLWLMEASYMCRGAMKGPRKLKSGGDLKCSEC